MRFGERRNVWIFFLVFGICLVALAIALNVGWILFSLERIALLVFGIIFFALIITGLVLNTTFLVREIRRNEQHNAFINSVTHELKTPVASIRLYLETLQTRELEASKREEFYAIMLKDTDRLLNTIEQVLQAGRISNKRRDQAISEVELNELLTESISMIENRYNFESRTVKFDPTENIFISGDQGELQTAFINLLDNAVKYSKDRIDVAVEIDNSDEKYVAVTIRDHGIGIPKTDIKRIFGRFYRATNADIQKAKGTGLGLAIVQAVIKKQGGKISAESNGENMGTTFVVKLRK